jgi:hypothetical protein
MATYKYLFITANELKKKSPISGNVDADKIVQYIEVAQETHVQNYMGTNLYDKITDLLADSEMDDVGNAAYKTLWVSYVKPMLFWFAQEAYLPFAMFQIENGGVYKHFSQNGETITLEEMRMMLQETRQNAEHYATRFIEYVRANSGDFPEYFTTSSDSDMYPDGDVNFAGGWVL